MNIAVIPLLFAILGLLMHGYAKNGKVASLGLALFTAAAVAFLILVGGPVPHLG